jgi:cytochrome c
LEKTAGKKDIEQFVNACIKNALKGKGIDPKSSEMADLVAYIKSLKGKTPGGITQEIGHGIRFNKLDTLPKR